MLQDCLLTRAEVEARTKLSRSTLYCKMREGTFPVPLLIGARAVRWRESDDFIADRPRATGDGPRAEA